MKWVIVQNVPINYHPAIMGDEEGRVVTFNSKQEAEDFVEKQDIQPYIGEDIESIMIVPEMETF